MSDEDQRSLSEAQSALNDMTKIMERAVPNGMGYLLLVVSPGDRGSGAGVTSNLDARDAPKLLRAIADQMDAEQATGGTKH